MIASGENNGITEHLVAILGTSLSLTFLIIMWKLDFLWIVEITGIIFSIITFTFYFLSENRVSNLIDVIILFMTFFTWPLSLILILDILSFVLDRIITLVS